jgi:hypothetical protein
MNTQTAKMTSIEAYTVARELGRESWKDSTLEAKQAAIRHYADVAEGRMTFEEFTEISEWFEKAAKSLDPERVAFGQAYLNTLTKLTKI